MRGRVAMIAALPREVAGLVKGWTAHREHEKRGIFVWSSVEAVVAAAGMGAARASLAVEAALALGEVSALYSVGLAGACDLEVRVGSVVEARVVVDTGTGERFATAASDGVVLATGAEIASVREKARLHAAYGAAVVDMEAATVARLALAKGIAFRAVKGVSDDASFELKGMGRFETKMGHFDTAAFALHTAMRPHTWGSAMRLGKHSGMALKALTVELQGRVAGGDSLGG